MEPRNFEVAVSLGHKPGGALDTTTVWCDNCDCVLEQGGVMMLPHGVRCDKGVALFESETLAEAAANA